MSQNPASLVVNAVRPVSAWAPAAHDRRIPRRFPHRIEARPDVPGAICSGQWIGSGRLRLAVLDPPGSWRAVSTLAGSAVVPLGRRTMFATPRIRHQRHALSPRQTAAETAR